MTPKRLRFFLSCLFLFFSSTIFAQSIEVRLKNLENDVRKKYDVKTILEKTAQLRSFEAWPEDLDPQLKLYVASRWIEDRHLTEARELLHQLEDNHADPVLENFYLGTLALEFGDLKTVKSVLDFFEASSSEDPDYLFLKSSYQAQTQDFNGATQTLTRVIERSGSNGKAYLQRGLFYLFSLSHELAYKDFVKAKALLPKSDVYHRQMAELQLGLIQLKFYNDRKKAEKHFKAGIAMDPQSSLVKELASRTDLY
jgi:tetratricopeptide (TPR) repeat protein